MLFLTLKTNAQVWESVGNSEGITTTTGSYIDITSNASNVYYLSYYDLDAMKGSVKKTSRSSWSYVGGSPGITEGVAFPTSIVTDKDDQPYFLYRNANDSYKLVGKTYVDDAWTTITAPTDSLVNGFKPAFNSNNELVVFMNEGGSYGTVKRFVDDQWEVIGKGFEATLWPYSMDMVINSEDTAYICFTADGYTHVYKNSVFADEESEWIPVVAENIDAAGKVAFCNSNLALDGEGNLYHQYYSGGNMCVIMYDGVTWYRVGDQYILSESESYFYDMVVTEDGVPYVAYTSDYTEVMTYNSTSEAWEKVGEGSVSIGEGAFNKLMLDAEGNVVITFNDSNYGKIVVKKLDPDAVAVQSIEITTDSDVDPVIDTDDGTLQLVANLYPSNASDTEVEWSIIDGANKASISKSGLVTATTSNDTITVKAAAVQNLSVYDTIRIAITNQFSSVSPESVRLSFLNDKNTDILSIGATIELEASVSPVEADQYIVWSIVEGSEYVSLSTDGVVTGTAEGFAIIRARTLTDETVYAEYSIAVFENGLSMGVENDGILNGYDVSEGNGLASADDFIVEEGKVFTVKKLRFVVWAYSDFNITSLNAFFYATINDTAPGRVLKYFEGLSIANQILTYEGDEEYQYMVEVNLDESISLTEGVYWVGPEIVTEEGTTVYWDITFNQELGFPYAINEGSWVNFSDGGFDAEFNVIGNYGESTNDVRINAVTSSLPRKLPAFQASGEKSFTVEVENQGIDTEEATLSVAQGETSFYNKTISLAADETKTVELTIDLGDCIANEDYALVFDLETSVDDNVLNNTDTVHFTTTDSTFVEDYEDVVNGDHGLGSSYGEIYLGNIFELYRADTLISVDMMFIYSSTLGEEEYAFEVYAVSETDTIDANNPLVEEIFVRGTDGGVRTSSFSPTPLEAGRYYFALHQLSTQNIGLSHDYTDGNYTVLVSGNALGAYYGYGAPHIRPNFTCTEVSEEETAINSQPAGIESALNIYPNPVVSTYTVSSSNTIQSISVYNAIGSLLLTQAVNEESVTLSAEDLKSGLYIVKVYTEAGESALRFHKQ